MPPFGVMKREELQEERGPVPKVPGATQPGRHHGKHHGSIAGDWDFPNGGNVAGGLDKGGDHGNPGRSGEHGNGDPRGEHGNGNGIGNVNGNENGIPATSRSVPVELTSQQVPQPTPDPINASPTFDNLNRPVVAPTDSPIALPHSYAPTAEATPTPIESPLASTATSLSEQPATSVSETYRSEIIITYTTPNAASSPPPSYHAGTAEYVSDAHITAHVTSVDTITIVKSYSNPPEQQTPTAAPPPPGSPHPGRVRDSILGSMLGAAFVLFCVAVFFSVRRYKRIKKLRLARVTAELDTESSGRRQPEMGTAQSTTVMMPSMSSEAPSPPFSTTDPIYPSVPLPVYTASHMPSPSSPVVIDPFADPTYNSSSGIEDYMVSQGISLGREPENPFLHPNDSSREIIAHPRPNSEGDFPPEYQTIEGGRRENRFPFGDDALSMQSRSENGSIQEGSVRQSPEYFYGDPSDVADGFHYRPSNYAQS